MIRLLRQWFSVSLGVVCLHRKDVFGGQQLDNLHRTFSCNTQGKDTLDGLGGFLVNNPFFIRRIFLIPIGQIGAEVFPGVPFHPHSGTDFLPGITGVEVIRQSRIKTDRFMPQ